MVSPLVLFQPHPISYTSRSIITEQICEVESQTVVFEQFHPNLHGFSRDLRRFSGRGVGYDSGIVSHFGDFFESVNDWGFSGYDLGRSYIIPSGSNWGSNSHFSVNSVYSAARSAISHF